jgi:hypothetical protein
MSDSPKTKSVVPFPQFQYPKKLWEAGGRKDFCFYKKAHFAVTPDLS